MVFDLGHGVTIEDRSKTGFIIRVNKNFKGEQTYLVRWVHPRDAAGSQETIVHLALFTLYEGHFNV